MFDIIDKLWMAMLVDILIYFVLVSFAMTIVVRVLLSDELSFTWKLLITNFAVLLVLIITLTVLQF